MRLPGRYRHGILVGGVASPQRLDKHGRRTLAPGQMFLTLLLLHLQREARSENSLYENEKNVQCRRRISRRTYKLRRRVNGFNADAQLGVTRSQEITRCTVSHTSRSRKQPDKLIASWFCMNGHETPWNDECDKFWSSWLTKIRDGKSSDTLCQVLYYAYSY